ncbi:hypothetical protein SAMN05444266_104477 [Chitinophaga jiangningensis]|uniref:Uncharacterized protein n=1 Tax=Chitinophaga jiangningensis TaxID=1419482 RepID=A0A1M7CU02_9BACT|nr:hypothetical protein [Chitinophaga jiangningensis]SHL70731.1 hypothetical protein SAMN05444266_104477 [Chitinophaga jiangningensis]
MKSAIRSRLLQLAASHLNGSTNNVIPPDPIITLLMEGLAGELAQLHQLHEQMLAGITQHLASVLLKNTVTTSLPGYTLLHATPTDITLIGQRHIFNPAPANHTFIPAGTHKLFPAELTHIIYPDYIVRMDDHLQPEVIITEPILTNCTAQIILMVTTSHPLLTNIAGLSLFFETTSPLQDEIYPLLPLLKCTINGQAAAVSQQYFHEEIPTDRILPDIYTQPALENYRQQTMMITSCDLTPNRNVAPPPILNNFLDKHLIDLPDCNWWITLEFPGMSHEYLHYIRCYINCFPAVNIGVAELIHTIHPLYNLFQLACEDEFLCLGRVTDQSGRYYKHVTERTTAELQPGEVNLLHAEKRRMDQRELISVLEHGTSRLKEELQLIGQLGHNNLLQTLEELTQKVNYIQEIVHEHTQRSVSPMIAFQPLEGSTHLTFEYFTTQGSQLPPLPPRSEWKEQATSIFRPGSIFNLATVCPGTPAPSPEKQVQLFRAQLYSQNRIVNGADIELCCRAILGHYCTHVRIDKGVILSVAAGHGYERTIDVYITLSSSATDCTPPLLEYYKKTVLRQLHQRGVGLVPYRVFLLPGAKTGSDSH